MSMLSDVARENGLMVVDAAPVQVINKDEITAAVARMKVIVSDSDKMTVPELTVIAQESILYRTVPGRDVHYFKNGDKLLKVFDYKYLKNLATFKEQLLSGDDSATVEDSYRPLTEAEKSAHNLNDQFIAAICTIITKRERIEYANEVKRWLDLSFAPELAVKMADKVLGGLGTFAIGAVKKTDNVPKGWSHLQLAEKLAFKNAINRKYGQPTADESAAMAYQMARRAMPKHWQAADPSQPIDVQARLADLEAEAERVQIESEQLTTAQRQERLQQNVVILHGNDEGAIGEDNADWLRFVEVVKFRIPFYIGEITIRKTLEAIGLEYDPDNEEMLFDELAKYANNEADNKADTTYKN